jgi:hypothetical protein
LIFQRPPYERPGRFWKRSQTKQLVWLVRSKKKIIIIRKCAKRRQDRTCISWAKTIRKTRRNSNLYLIFSPACHREEWLRLNFQEGNNSDTFEFITYYVVQEISRNPNFAWRLSTNKPLGGILIKICLSFSYFLMTYYFFLQTCDTVIRHALVLTPEKLKVFIFDFCRHAVYVFQPMYDVPPQQHRCFFTRYHSHTWSDCKHMGCPESWYVIYPLCVADNNQGSDTRCIRLSAHLAEA